MAPARVLRVAVTEEFEKITELGVREVRCRHAPQVGPIHLTREGRYARARNDHSILNNLDQGLEAVVYLRNSPVC